MLVVIAKNAKLRTRAQHGRLKKDPTVARKSERGEAKHHPIEGGPTGLSRESETQGARNIRATQGLRLLHAVCKYIFLKRQKNRPNAETGWVDRVEGNCGLCGSRAKTD